MDLFEIISTVALALVPILLGLGMRWVRNQKWADDGVKEFTVYLEAFGERLRVSYADKLAQARAEDSDGGATITEAEREQILDEIYEDFKAEITGPGKDYALSLGATTVKNLLLGWLNKDGDE